MKKAVILIVIGLMILTLGACSLIPTGGEKADATKDVSSSDGLLQITVPESYKESDILNADANLQLMNAAMEQYTITIFESNVDFSDDFTLDDYSDAVSSSMGGVMTSPEFSDIESLTINGYDAKQYTLSGEIEKIKIKYLVTLVGTDNGYYQVISWSLQSRFDNALDTFKQIAESFTEL